MSASLAVETERGRVVGTVMSGLLIGILLARTFSGLVAAAFGWRVVFWVAAAIMVALALTLRLRLPRVPPTTDMRYRGVLRSVLSLIAAEPVLRLRMRSASSRSAASARCGRRCRSCCPRRRSTTATG